MKLRKTFLACVGISVSCVPAAAFAADAEDDGNRYNRPRYYDSEISSAEAYLDVSQNKLVILDVRRLREYAAGHPERAYNVPYPHIYDGDQTAENFYWEAYDIVKGRTDTPIMTLCRTGSRSIDAANILSDPQNTAGDPRRTAVPGGIPFTNVRNNWDGFVGQYRYAFAGSAPATDPLTPLDLNNNGELDQDFADIFPDTNPSADANPDKDGWRNFQGLPWTTRILRPRAYLQDASLYTEFQYGEEEPPRGGHHGKKRKHGHGDRRD